MRNHVVILSLLLGGCMFSYTPAGPTYTGWERDQARLIRIAEAPSAEGAVEAVDRWVAAPKNPTAQRAVLACADAFPGPLEARFAEASEEGRKLFFEEAQKALTGESASGLIARLSRLSGMAVQGIAALAGRQDPTAVQSLLDMARGAGSESVRVDAVEGLRPASTPLAREGLRTIAEDSDLPLAVRARAVTVLAPLDGPERAAVMSLGINRDDALAVAVLASMGKARSASEYALLVDASRKDKTVNAALDAIERSFEGQPIPGGVEARLVELVNLTQTVPTGAPRVRLQAARVLATHGDARAYPALVALLDDANQRDPAARLLGAQVVAMVPTLRTDIGRLQTAGGKNAAARLLAAYGGPQDAAVLQTTAAANELQGLLAALPSAPWGLFPEGKVAYVPAIADGARVEQSLLDAVRAGAKLRTEAEDPVTRYVGAARAYLAGGRDRVGTEALRTAAGAARESFGLATRAKVEFSGNTFAGNEFVDQLTSTVTKQSGVRSVPATSATGPALTATGTLSCTVNDTTTRKRLADERYSYDLVVTNPVKVELKRQLDAVPWNLRMREECTNECTYNPSTTAQYKSMMPCDYIPVNVDAVCRKTVKQVPTPEYAGLTARYEAEPARITQTFEVPMTQTEVTETKTERCEGSVSLAVGASKHVAPVSYSGKRSSAVIERFAQPVGAEGEKMPPWKDFQTGARSDDMATQRTAAVTRALAGYRPGEAEVRRMYADHVKVALAAGDLPQARQSLVWARADLIGTDVASLGTFRTLFFSADAGAFPGAWR